RPRLSSERSSLSNSQARLYRRNWSSGSSFNIASIFSRREDIKWGRRLACRRKKTLWQAGGLPHDYLYFAKSIGPPYNAAVSSSSSIRKSWLYLAIRSVRDAEPVLICPVFIATARSAIVASSVSPLRWLEMLV